MIPGMGSTMAGGGGSSAAPGVEGAINSVPPPSPSASGGGGAVVAVDPPPVTVGAQGEKGAPEWGRGFRWLAGVRRGCSRVCECGSGDGYGGWECDRSRGWRYFESGIQGRRAKRNE